MSTNTQEAADLLAAGAILPVGTPAGPDAVTLEARSYRHPALADRVVIRVISSELRQAEDAAAAFLGMVPAEVDGAADRPAAVGIGPRKELGFPEWVLIHHPADGHHALDVMPEMDRAAQYIATKPKKALDAYVALGERLAGAVPHFLPTYYEQVGRSFLAEHVDNYAAQMFARARRAEAEHGLPIDEDRLDAVFLEFAAAGALPATQVQAYARDLAGRVPAPEALHRFRRLAVRRVAAGLIPSPATTASLRKLARAAGEDPKSVEVDYLAEVLQLPATLRASSGWWKTHREAFVAVAAKDPTLPATLLDVIPTERGQDIAELWLELLRSIGALDVLADPDAPGQPRDGAAGWLGRFLRLRGTSRDAQAPMPALEQLVRALVDRLRVESVSAPIAITEDVDLLDLALAEGITVAAPTENARLSLWSWADAPERRDLSAVVADAPFRAALARGLRNISGDDEDHRLVAAMCRFDGTREVLAEWVRGIAAGSSAKSLIELPDALGRIGRVPAQALRLAEPQVRAVVATDVAETLAATLRVGTLDEWGWPAWDDAVRELVSRGRDLLVADAWPYLVVAGPAQARVLGPDGPVLVHDLRPPADASGKEPGFHYVDGELLVSWRAQGVVVGYWHARSGGAAALSGRTGLRGRDMYFYAEDNIGWGLPLPGGGWTTGLGALNVGDTEIPEDRPVMSDGMSFWVWAKEGEESPSWHEYDPATGAVGRAGMPGVIADVLGRAPSGLSDIGWWVRPAAYSGPSAAAVQGGAGLVGWVRGKLPDGSWFAADLAGNTVHLPEGRGMPVAALRFPGAEQPTTVVRGGWSISLYDADGVRIASAKTDQEPGEFAEGTAILAPRRFWHYLRPRDLAGSAALRGIDRDRAAALLRAVQWEPGDVVPDGSTGTAQSAAERRRALRDAEQITAVRAVLPQITDDALARGVLGIARFALTQHRALEKVAAKLTQRLDEADLAEVTGPTDFVLEDALSGLTGDVRRAWQYRGRDSGHRRTCEQIHVVAAMLPDAGTGADAGPADPADPADPAAQSVDPAAPSLVTLPNADIDVPTLLSLAPGIAVRAASAVTRPEHREADIGLLAALGSLEPSAAGRWQAVTVDMAEQLSVDPSAADTPRAMRFGSTLLVIADPPSRKSPQCAAVVAAGGDLELPAGGHLELPAGIRVISAEPLCSDLTPGWAPAFLAELDRRGPAPWRPEAVEEFARLTGVTDTVAALLLAGAPQVDNETRGPLTADERKVLGATASAVGLAREELAKVSARVRARVVAALLPADPAAWWESGPDVVRAAAVWNEAVGRRFPLPEQLIAEAGKALNLWSWSAPEALRAVVEPGSLPALQRDLEWVVERDHVAPVEGQGPGFTGSTLRDGVAAALWLAHHLPAGDPIRRALPGFLELVRERVAHPGFVLSANWYEPLPEFRKLAGTPTETGDGFERYGALIMATHDDSPRPAVRVDLLDPLGEDPYLPALRAEVPGMAHLRLVRSPAVAALLADPGDPAAGERFPDGTWWPQDPTRSVPDVVAAAADHLGLRADAAALYLMLAAMADPTDRNVKRWTGWKPARIKAATAELAASGHVIEAVRARAGRKLFLPGPWRPFPAPRLPLELWTIDLYDRGLVGDVPPGLPIVPTEPVADLYRRAWQRIAGGDLPRFKELTTPRGHRR